MLEISPLQRVQFSHTEYTAASKAYLKAYIYVREPISVCFRRAKFCNLHDITNCGASVRDVA